MTVEELGAGGGQAPARALALPAGSLLPAVTFSPGATGIRFSSNGPFGAYWVVSEAGFDKTLPQKPEARAVEVFRTYETADGKPVTSVKLGEEVTAVVRVRSLASGNINNLAIVDLLPGGFEPVVQAPPASASGGDGASGEGDGDGEGAAAEEGSGESEGDEGEGGGEAEGGSDGDGGDVGAAARGFALSIALPGNTFMPEFGDVREDRVVLYGAAATEAQVLKYAIKATNVGTYTVAPIQATALYDSTIAARGVAGKITVVPR